MDFILGQALAINLLSRTIWATEQEGQLIRGKWEHDGQKNNMRKCAIREDTDLTRHSSVTVIVSALSAETSSAIGEV